MTKKNTMIFNYPKNRKNYLLGFMLLTSLITFDYLNSQNTSINTNSNFKEAGFLGTGRKVTESACVDGQKVVQTEYKLLWIFTLGERTSEIVDC